MSISLQPRPSQLTLHSPEEEEDLGWREPWYHSDDELDPSGVGIGTTNRSQHTTKGKAKATGYKPRSSSPNGGTDGPSNLPSQRRTVEAYPPTTNEDTDTQRVVKNLRRWEIAERQRWKAARESTSGPTSMLADAARRATSLWSRRASHPRADGGGKHRVLESSEDGGQTEYLAPSPSHSAATSRTPSPLPGEPQTGPYARFNDPFSDPPGSTSSLFVNAQPITSDIGSSASFESVTGSSSSESTKVAKPVNVPVPLDLPKPRSPPPRTATPHANRPPEPFPRPDSRMAHACDDEDEKPVRWWTDWLCGCNEGPDRGGEAQAGRTNPLE